MQQTLLLDPVVSQAPYLAQFQTLMDALLVKRQYTAVLDQLAGIGVYRPGHCKCSGAAELSSWYHLNHGKYNQAVRHAIQRRRIREKLHRAASRELLAEMDADGYGPIIQREYARELCDFLRAVPRLEWFR